MLLQRLFSRLYGNPIIRNDLRGELVEEMVAVALEPEWRHCSDDWAAWDFEHAETGARIQVKQSALRQTWAKEGFVPTPPRFSIEHKTGFWKDGLTWVERRGRQADLFVFGWHPLADDSADHRVPEQWQFFVVPEAALPREQKSVGLSMVRALARPVGIGDLAAAVGAFTGALAK